MKKFDLAGYRNLILDSLKYYLDVFRKAIHNHKRISTDAISNSKKVSMLYDELKFANGVSMNHDDVRKILACVLFYGSNHSKQSLHSKKFNVLMTKLIMMFKESDDKDDVKRILKIIHDNQTNLLSHANTQAIIRILQM